jgi:hypothetical protein
MTYTRNFAPWCLILGITLCVPFAAKPDAIVVNGTCEQNCGFPTILSNGTSTSGDFNFDYTFGDGDVYDVSGNYSASYSTVDGSTIAVNPTFTYEGASPSVGSDTLTFDMYQLYFDTTPGTWAGTYTESIPLSLGATAGPGSTIEGQLLYDGQSVGLVGPFGPGTYSVTNSKSLDFGPFLNNAPFLLADFQFTADFGAGTLPGTSASGASPAATPEPATDLACGLGLILFVYVGRRRSRSRNAA